MKATYNPEAKTKFTSSHRKEGKCYFHSYAVVSLDQPKAPDALRLHSLIELRIYGTGNVNTACLWVAVPDNAKSIYTSGSGRAGGYGYHRPSAAAGEAISNAGFALSASIDGVGEAAICEALLAMAKALKIKRPALIQSYQ